MNSAESVEALDTRKIQAARRAQYTAEAQHWLGKLNGALEDLEDAAPEFDGPPVALAQLAELRGGKLIEPNQLIADSLAMRAGAEHYLSLNLRAHEWHVLQAAVELLGPADLETIVSDLCVAILEREIPADKLRHHLTFAESQALRRSVATHIAHSKKVVETCERSIRDLTGRGPVAAACQRMLASIAQMLGGSFVACHGSQNCQVEEDRR